MAQTFALNVLLQDLTCSANSAQTVKTIHQTDYDTPHMIPIVVSPTFQQQYRIHLPSLTRTKEKCGTTKSTSKRGGGEAEPLFDGSVVRGTYRWPSSENEKRNECMLAPIVVDRSSGMIFMQRTIIPFPMNTFTKVSNSYTYYALSTGTSQCQLSSCKLSSSMLKSSTNLVVANRTVCGLSFDIISIFCGRPLDMQHSKEI
ncbi:hypothetical protein V8B97DRAFT_1966028 [Scleroderma yunnanense]